jgi:hypothetical protein
MFKLTIVCRGLEQSTIGTFCVNAKTSYSATGEQTTGIGDRVDINPLSYILPKQKPKYMDITEFVQGTSQEIANEQVLGEADGGQIIFKTGARKVRLDQVSPKWLAANLRILVELLRTGVLKQSVVFDYISYTVKISELTDSYQWSSILNYVRAYRMMQAQHCFRWMSDTPHLDSLHLRPRFQQGNTAKCRYTPPVSRGGLTHTQLDRSPAEQPQTCRLFQRNACPWGDACRYKHICSAL